MVMDRHYLELNLNTAAKSSMKRKIFNKCVKQAVLEAASVILMLLQKSRIGFFSFLPAIFKCIRQSHLWVEGCYLCGNLFLWLTSCYENGVVYDPPKDYSFFSYLGLWELMTPTFKIVHQVVRISLDIFSQRDFTGGDWRIRRGESSRAWLCPSQVLSDLGKQGHL